MNQLTVAEVKGNVGLIQQVMKAVMKKDVHYGVIPGCKKPSLLKPGSEKILSTFRLACEPIVDDLSTEDCFRYRVTTRLTNMETGNFVGSGIGECSSDEDKYKWRKAICEAEWEETDELRRREKWVKAWDDKPEYKVKQVRANAADIANTILKMAKKRSQIDATLTATAASDIFDQDIQDLPPEMQQEISNSQPNTKPTVEPPTSKSQTNGDLISDPQAKRFYAIAKGVGLADDYINKWLMEKHNLKSSRDIPKNKYEEICNEVQKV